MLSFISSLQFFTPTSQSSPFPSPFPFSVSSSFPALLCSPAMRRSRCLALLIRISCVRNSHTYIHTHLWQTPERAPDTPTAQHKHLQRNYCPSTKAERRRQCTRLTLSGKPSKEPLDNYCNYSKPVTKHSFALRLTG